jgi:tetratricopeptide (TPR) repeat protein
MKIRLFLFLIACFSLAGRGLAQVAAPISSVYTNTRNDKSPVIKAMYSLLDGYYDSRITAKELALALNKFDENLSARENAMLNMALSYTKTEEGDFGFYNLRLAVKDAETLPDNDIVKGVVFAEFGNYLFARETHDLAIEFFRKSIPILDQYKPEDMEGPGFSLQNKILRAFTELSELDSVKVYVGKVIAHAQSYKDKIWLSSAYNNNGYRFYDEKKFDSALVYYRLAQSCLNPAMEAHLIFYENIRENIAHIHAKRNEYAQALALLDTVIDVRLKYPAEAFSVIQGLNYYTDYCTLAGRAPAAIDKFNRCLPLLRQSGKEFESSPKYIKLKMKLAKLSGNTAEYVDYFNRLLEKERKNLETEKQLLVNRKGINKYVKSRNDVFEKQLEIEKLQKAKLRQSVTYRNIFIIILALLSCMAVYSIYSSARYKKRLLQAENEKLQQREQILDLANINLKTNIELKEKDISRVVADNKLRTEIKRDFLKKLEEMSGADEKKVKTEIRRLRTELGQTIDQHGKIDLLQHNIDNINIQFESKLRQAIAGITQSEIEICSLIRLGYNNTGVANIINKTPENVRVNKFRIKQKAGIEDMKELERLLKEL